MCEVKDFLPSYPKPGDPSVAKRVSEMKEFDDLRLGPEEGIPSGPGNPLLHQELQARFFAKHTMSDKGILWHGLGTGKTCTASIIAERFKGDPEKRALILVKNSHLREAFRSEIARVCTKGIYLPSEAVGEEGVLELTQEAKQRRLNAAISKTYQIATFGELLDKKNLPNTNAIKEGYSGRLIVVDEVHNLRVQPNKHERTLYESLHFFLHAVENCRILLLSATPIWDKVYDIASLLNLLLPLDDQLPVLDKFTREFFDKEGTLIPSKAAELKNKVRGKISFVRSLVSSARRTEVGTKRPWMKWVTVFPSAMSDFQSTFVKTAWKESETDAFLANARDASNCVFPVFDDKGKVVGGAYGTAAFKKYAVRERKRWVLRRGREREEVTYGNFEFGKNLAKALGPSPGPDPLSGLARYSSKFAAIIRCLKDPEALKEKAFVYGGSVKGSGGVITFALVLKLHGFTWIKTADEIPRKARDPRSPGAFVVMTSEDQTISDPAQIRRAIRAFNADDNAHGERLRIIIGSDTMAQGHTFKATKQGHVLTPTWNLPGTDQPKGRIYRTGAFDQLPREERGVRFFRHVAVDGEGKETVDIPDLGTFSTEGSVDTYVYGVAEGKERMNSQVLRLVKESSWDCALAYGRNVLAADEDGTRDCDFVECNYACDGMSPNKEAGERFLAPGQGTIWTFPPSGLESSNYNVLYSEDEVDAIARRTKEVFKTRFALSLVGLEELVRPSSRRLLLEAVRGIVDDDEPIRNKYGFESFLREEGNVLFLVDDPLPPPDLSDAAYNAFPLVTEVSSLSEAIEVHQLEGDMEKVEKFAREPSEELLNSLSHKAKILVLEEVVAAGRKAGRAREVVERVLGGEIHTSGDGRKVHNMYNTEFRGAGYNVFTKNLKANGKMRVFDGSWTNVSQKDESKFIKEIKDKVASNVKKGLKDNPWKIYGAVDKAQKLKIVDDRAGKAKTGRVCKTIPATDVWGIFAHLRHLPFSDEVPAKVAKMTSGEVRKAIENGKREWRDTPWLREDLTDDQRRGVLTMLTMSKDSLCNSLERWFKREDLYVVL